MWLSECRLPPGRPPDSPRGNHANARGRELAHRLLDVRRMIDLDDRPRERLWRSGVTRLADDELIAILLGCGVRDRPAIAVARALRESAGTLANLSRASPPELALVDGIGEARAARIAAAFELGRRVLQPVRPLVIAGAAELHALLAPRIAGVAQEVFFAIGVDVRNQLIDVVEIARGTVCSVDVHPREVFRPMIRMAAAGAIVAHNHPSGDPAPSIPDLELTTRLHRVGELVGITLLDHVVITPSRFQSIRELAGCDD